MRREPLYISYPRLRQGFTLVEVLVAIIVLLVGVVVALRVFPRGLDVLNRTERSTQALEQVERLRMLMVQQPEMLAEAVLPVDQATLPPQELLAWRDLRAVQIAGTDPDWYRSYLFPVSQNQRLWPLWQPVSARVYRRLIGERCVIASEFSTTDRAVFAPKYLVQFGPIEDATQITIYDLRYRKVSKADLLALLPKAAQLADTLYYAVDYADGKMYFLPEVSSGTRTARLAFSAIDGSGKLVSTQQSIDIPNTPNDLTTVSLGAAALPGSEQVHRAYTRNTTALPSALQSGEFSVQPSVAGEGLLSGPIFFSRDDVGRTVKIDYTVADWGIMREDVTVDADGYIQLSFSPKMRNIPKLPRESTSWGLYGPMKANAIVMELINSDSGAVIPVLVDNPDIARPTYDFFGAYALQPDRNDFRHWRIVEGAGVGADAEAGKALSGTRYRVYYRANYDWTVQYFRAPATFYATSTNAATRAELADETLGLQAFAVLVEGTKGWLAVPAVYAGQTLAIDYQYALPAGEKSGVDDERLLKRIEGEVHVVPAGATPSSVLLLKHPPAAGTEVRVRGFSVTIRALWAQQRSGPSVVIGQGNPFTKTISDSWLAKQTTVIVPPSAE